MKLLELLASAAGGGLFGILGQLAVGWFEIFRADKESARRLREMEALREMKAQEGELRAFDSSQQAGKAAGNEPAWAAAVLTLTRPFLTLLLLSFAVFVYATATGQTRDDMTGEITACAFGAVWWWFGSRYQSRVRSGK